MGDGVDDVGVIVVVVVVFFFTKIVSATVFCFLLFAYIESVEA